MNTQTGELVDMEFVEKLKKMSDPSVKFYKEVPSILLPEIQGMNRSQRREWYRKNKKRIKKALEVQAREALKEAKKDECNI